MMNSKKRSAIARRNRRRGIGILAIIFALLLPAAALAAEIPVDIGQGNVRIDGGNVIQYQARIEDGIETPYDNANDQIVISGESQATLDSASGNACSANTVTVAIGAGREVHIVLKDLVIDSTEIETDEWNSVEKPPINIESGNVNIELQGANVLTGGSGSAGLQTSYEEGEGSLHISGSGTLEAMGSVSSEIYPVDENGTRLQWPDTEETSDEEFEKFIKSHALVANDYAAAGIGGGAQIDIDPETTVAGAPILNSGADITIAPETEPNITAVGGRSYIYEKQDDGSEVRVYGESEAEGIGASVKYATTYYPAETLPAMNEPAIPVEEIAIDGAGDVKLAVKDMVVEEKTEGDKKVIAAEFKDTSGTMNIAQEDIKKLVEAGFAAVELKLADGSQVKLDLGALQERLGTVTFKNLTIRYKNGKPIVYVVDKNGKLIDVTDLLTAV